MKAEYVNHMGDDLAVVNAARVSFDKTSTWAHICDTCGKDMKTTKCRRKPVGGAAEGPLPCSCTKDSLREADAKLISYLAKHDHWTPFAHTSITLRMQAPVPIRTQCFKHKFGFVENEESRRYVSGSPTLFMPGAFRSKPEGSVKQGSGGEHPNSRRWLRLYAEEGDRMITLYEDMIAEGVCPEQARFVLSQGVEVQWIWTGSLAAYARFYRQRTDPHAQHETQDLARMVGAIIEPLFPTSWKALTEGGGNACSAH